MEILHFKEKDNVKTMSKGAIYEYILAFAESQPIFWVVVGSGECFVASGGWWKVMVDGGEYISAGGWWWWEVLDGGGWWHSLA